MLLFSKIESKRTIVAGLLPITYFYHTVDCLQTIGVCEQRTVRLFLIDRIFVSNVFMSIENIR